MIGNYFHELESEMDFRNRTCDPCRFQRKRSKAKTFCETCEEYYCKQCTKQHLKFRMSMGHSIVRGTRIHANNHHTGIVNQVFESNELSDSLNGGLCPKEKSFQLHVLETDASRRCHLSGCCRITIDTTGIMLTDTRHPEVTFNWPYTSIRKIGSMENKIFFFESGRRSQSGEGRFVLMTHDASVIHSVIADFIRKIQIEGIR